MKRTLFTVKDNKTGQQVACFDVTDGFSDRIQPRHFRWAYYHLLWQDQRGFVTKTVFNQEHTFELNERFDLVN